MKTAPPQQAMSNVPVSMSATSVGPLPQMSPNGAQTAAPQLSPQQPQNGAPTPAPQLNPQQRQFHQELVWRQYLLRLLLQQTQSELAQLTHAYGADQLPVVSAPPLQVQHLAVQQVTVNLKHLTLPYCISSAAAQNVWGSWPMQPPQVPGLASASSVSSAAGSLLPGSAQPAAASSNLEGLTMPNGMQSWLQSQQAQSQQQAVSGQLPGWAGQQQAKLLRPKASAVPEPPKAPPPLPEAPQPPPPREAQAPPPVGRVAPEAPPPPPVAPLAPSVRPTEPPPPPEQQAPSARPSNPSVEPPWASLRRAPREAVAKGSLSKPPSNAKGAQAPVAPAVRAGQKANISPDHPVGQRHSVFRVAPEARENSDPRAQSPESAAPPDQTAILESAAPREQNASSPVAVSKATPEPPQDSVECKNPSELEAPAEAPTDASDIARQIAEAFAFLGDESDSDEQTVPTSLADETELEEEAAEPPLKRARTEEDSNTTADQVLPSITEQPVEKISEVQPCVVNDSERKTGMLPPLTDCTRCGRKGLPGVENAGVFCGRITEDGRFVGCGSAICWRCMRRGPNDQLGAIRTTKEECESLGNDAWWMHDFCMRDSDKKDYYGGQDPAGEEVAEAEEAPENVDATMEETEEEGDGVQPTAPEGSQADEAAGPFAWE